MKTVSKLTLSRETLWQMDTQKDSTVINPIDVSCVQSCYFQSCGGGCTISTGQKD
ncbi:MAG TPA: hypothetical protein VGH73_07310 [Thermoanaerobaculia bacterium]|jgi:hypothetical protein